MFENQENLHLSLQKERQNRFDRNKRAAGEHKLNRTYKVGEKIYLTFPKGKFRPVGGSTKLSHRNDGPYTVLEEIQGGLVYRVKHDVSNYVRDFSGKNDSGDYYGHANERSGITIARQVEATNTTTRRPNQRHP